MILVMYEDDWADEMDIYGFCLMTSEQWKYKKNEIKHTSFPQEVYFGTNEYNVYENPEEFLNKFTEKEVTESEAKTINKFFTSDYGRFPFIEGHAPNEFYEKYGHCPKSKR